MSASERGSRKGAGLEEDSGPEPQEGRLKSKRVGGAGSHDGPGLDPTRTDLERGGWDRAGQVLWEQQGRPGWG